MKKFFKIKNKCGMDLSQTEELFHDLGRFAQKRFGFKKPPTLHLVSDHKNALKPLGKTAYYDPQGMAVTLYTDNRHIKDILRSLAHELVHHMQNENGMLNDSGYHGKGYAQKNKNMREIERQAFEEGSLCMRDWEDGLKELKPTIYNEWRNKTMSIKKWKNNELMENLSKKFGLKMDLAQLNESSCGSKDKYEEVYRDGEDGDPFPNSSLRGQAPPNPKHMRKLGPDGKPQKMFPDVDLDEQKCPECKNKGDECKCPDKKELKEKEKKVKMVDKDDVNESKLRDIIREIILSEMKRK